MKRPTNGAPLALLALLALLLITTAAWAESWLRTGTPSVLEPYRRAQAELDGLTPDQMAALIAQDGLSWAQDGMRLLLLLDALWTESGSYIDVICGLADLWGRHGLDHIGQPGSVEWSLVLCLFEFWRADLEERRPSWTHTEEEIRKGDDYGR